MEDSSKPEEVLFEAAMQRPAGERAAYLKAACGDDAKLYGRVMELLDAHEQGADFLNEPAFTSPSVSLSEGPGSVIGRYKLLEQIGEGGFGVVFMAEQEHPVRRRVALKIIKMGMDTRQVIARFEAERQALAMMDHPHVARVLDGGATDTGRPYFVMELVRGIPITEYCDKHKLTIPQRLELFIQICQAIQHAHQKGLIHRDLKPSNILVKIEDDRAMAKIIDFGIAKATQARLTEKTLFTEFNQMIGTPAYMSPEQTGGDLDIDTRTDVYALGALLYEMLVGAPLFDPKELRSKGYAEMQRIIREVEPPTPSTRLVTLKDSLTSVAAHRGIEPHKLTSLVRGELDWIVMRCLEKDRRRRYQTASQLAEDIQNYLADQPVTARAATRTYRMMKLMHRNKAAFAAVSIVLLTILLGGIVSTWQAIRATRAEAVATEQADRANREADQERQVKEAAVAAENRAVLTLADMHTARGTALSSFAGNTSALWFAKAATIATDQQRKESNLIRAKSWQAGDWTPMAAVRDSRGPADQLLFNPKNPRYLIAILRGEPLDVRCSVWDLAKERQLPLPSGFESSTIGTWTSDGQLVLATSEGHVARISIADMTVLNRWEAQKSICALAVSADGRLVAAAAGKQLLVWQLEAPQAADPVVELYSANVVYVAFSEKSDHIVTASDDDEAHVFVMATGENNPLTLKEAFPPIRHLYRRYSSSTSLIAPLLMSGGQVLVTMERFGNDAKGLGTLRWTVVSSGREVGFDTNVDGPYSSAVSTTGKTLYRGGGGSIRTYNTFSQRFGEPYLGKSNALALNPRRPVVASAAGTGVLSLLRLDGDEAVTAPYWSIRSPPVKSLSFSEDGQLLAMGGVDGLIRIWRLPAENLAVPQLAGPVLEYAGKTNLLDLSPNGINKPANAHSERSSLLTFSPDGRFVATSGILDGNGRLHSVQIWGIGDATPEKVMIRLEAALVCAVFSPDSQLIAAVTGQNSDLKQLRIWNWRLGKEICPAYQLPAGPAGLVYAPDGRNVVVQCVDGKILFIDPVNGSLRQQCAAASRDGMGALSVNTICFSHDGQTIYTFGTPLVQAWEYSTGSLRYSITLADRCTYLTESPDGQMLATANASTMQFWSAASGQPLPSPITHAGTLGAMVFSPDSQSLAACWRDERVRIFDVPTRKLIRTLDVEDDVTAFTFTSDGRQILTACNNLTYRPPRARMWDIQTGFPLTPYLVSTGGYGQQISVSPDGRRAAVGASATDYGVLIDLGQFTSTAGATPQDTLLWSELVSDARIDHAETVTLTSDEWFDRWHQYRARHPEYRPFEN